MMAPRSDCPICSGTGLDEAFGSSCDCELHTAEGAQAFRQGGAHTKPNQTKQRKKKTMATAKKSAAKKAAPAKKAAAKKAPAKASFWDDEEVQAAVTQGSYHKLAAVGDYCEGRIEELSKRVFAAGTDRENVAIEIEFDDGSIFTAGQVALKRTLVEQRPSAGDYITIELAEIKAIAGGQTLKLFRVDIEFANGEQVSIDQSEEG